MRSSEEITKEFRERWERHDPFRNIASQLSLIEKLKDEADRELEKYQIGTAIPDWTLLYYNLALNSIVSSLEFFFRELVLNDHILNSIQKSRYYNKTTGKFVKLAGNFQNYNSIRDFLQNEFKIDIETKMTPLEIEWLKLIIMIRHLLTHNGGIIDNDFMNLIKSFSHLKVLEYTIGKNFWVNSEQIYAAKKVAQKVGEIVEDEVTKLDKSDHEIFFG